MLICLSNRQINISYLDFLQSRKAVFFFLFITAWTFDITISSITKVL
ncbi:MAG: hypothetical protein ACI8X3_002116 [Saprospiraceae bacterium]|jgi:hypothetical protein